MERRMLLAVVLSFLAVMSYSAITGRGCMAPPKKDTEETPADAPATPPANGTGPGQPVQPAPRGPDDPPPANGDGQTPKTPDAAGPVAPHPHADVAPTRGLVESEELRMEITSQGGAVHALQLKNVLEGGKQHPLDLILPVDPLLTMGVTDDTGLIPDVAPGGAGRRRMPAGEMRSLHWRTTQEEGAVRCEFETRAGIVYTKRWSLAQGKGKYHVKLELSARARKPTNEKAVAVKLLAASGQIRERVQGAFAAPNGVIYRLSGSGDVSPLHPFGIAETSLQLTGRSRERLQQFGSRSPYFMSTYFATDDAPPAIRRFWATGEDASQRESMEVALEKFYKDERQRTLDEDPLLDERVVVGVRAVHHAWMVVSLPLTTPTKPSVLNFYNGPVDRETIRGQNVYKTMDPVFTWPSAFDFIAEILLWVYDFWRNLLGSAGLGVILMTICVRGAMVPISVRNQLSMRKYGRRVAKLKPKVKALQEKYRSNPKKLREQQMLLYREHGVGFPTGCLMMLIQIPIFFALFSCLRVEYTIRGAEFLWISDLSGPDRLIDFGSRIVDLGFLYIESLNILPLLMVALSIIHMRNMPTPADEQQAQQMKMMKWLPIVFAVILYNYTAALALYMVLSSAVAILEARIVRAKDDDDADVPQGHAPAAKMT